MVNVSSNLRKFINPAKIKDFGKMLLPGKTPIEAYTIPIISSYQIYDDFKHSDKTEKGKVVLKDIIVLAATCLGAFCANAATKKLLSKNFSHIKDETIKFISIPLGGLVSGVIAGETSEILLPTKNLNLKKAAKEVVEETIVEEDKLNKKTEESIKENEDTKQIKQRKEHKLLKTVLVMSATCMGVFAGNSAAKMAIKKLNLTAVADTLGVTSILAGGIASNFITRGVLNHIFPETTAVEKAKESLKDVRESNRLFGDNVEDLFNSTSSTLKGFAIGKQKGLENKVKKGFYETISGIVIPAAIILPSTKIIQKSVDTGSKSTDELLGVLHKLNKYNPLKKLQEEITNNHQLQKTILKKSIIFPITISSLYIGQSVGNWFNQRITNKILKEEMWSQVLDARENLIKSCLKSVSSNDKDAQKEAVKNLAKVKEIEKIVNPEEIEINPKNPEEKVET